MRRRLLIARGLVHRPRLVLLDEPTVGLDPQVRQELWALVDPLRSEGTTILMSTHYIEEAERLCDTVTIMSHGSAVASGAPRELVAEHAGAEAVEVYGPPAKLAEVEREARAAGLKTRRTGTSVSVLGVNGNAPRRRAPPDEPRGRLRAADRRGDLVSERHRPPRAPRPDGRARPRDHQLLELLALDTFSATVEPTVYLLAFGFGFGSLVSTVGGYDYVDFVGTGTVATAVLFSSAFPGMFGTFVKYTFQRTYDAILAAPVDTEELVTAEALWIGSRRRLRLRPDARRDGLRARPELRDAARARSSASSPASAGPTSGSDRRADELDRELQLRHQRRADAADALRRHVLPDRRAPALGAGARDLNPLYHCVELVRHAVFGFEPGADAIHLAVIVGFGLITWRLAIHWMTQAPN